MPFSFLKKPTSLRLGTKSILAVTMLLSAISITLTTSFITRQKSSLTDELHKRVLSLASNLAFESSEGIVTIPEQCREVIPQANNDYRVVVKGLEEIIWQAYCEARLFSELGVPWATSPTEVSGASYTEFPRSAKLRAYLQDVLEGYWTP